MSSVVSEITLDWPKDSQKYEIYIDEEGMCEVVFGSQQSKAKTFRRHCCNIMFPHIRQHLTKKKMKEDHQKVIDKKDATIALLIDDLKALEFTNDKYQQAIEEKDNQVQGIKHENVAL